MRFQLQMTEADRRAYQPDGDLVLDFTRLDEDTDCETLIAWEGESNYTLHMLKVMSDLRSAEWKRALAWFALKQSGSELAFADFRPRGLGGLRITRLPGGDAVDPPASAPDPSGTDS